MALKRGGDFLEPEVGTRDECTQEQCAADFAARNLDLGLSEKGRGFLQFLKGLYTQAPWEEAGNPHARRADGVDVGGAGLEQGCGAVHPVVEEGCGGVGLEEELGWGEAGGTELVGREVAASGAQVGWEVAQDVYELQCAAVVACELGEGWGREVGVGGEVVEANVCPEFAHAAGDEVGVVFEGMCVRKGEGLAGIREAVEVEALAFDNGGHDGAHALRVCVGEGVEPVEAGGQLCNQACFGGVGWLDVALELLDAASVALAEHEGEGVEELLAERGRALGRICDGVTGAREEVAHADGAADGGREDADAEVKRTGDGGEEVAAEGVVSHGRLEAAG